MNTLEGAIAFLRENGARYWRLEVRYQPGEKFTKLFAYEPTVDVEVDKTEDSVVQLQRKIGYQNHPTAQYQLFCKKGGATSTDKTEFGPYPFTYSGQATNHIQQPQNNNPFGVNLHGLGGIGDLGTILQIREQALTDRFNSALNSKDKEWELKQKEAELAKKEAELKELEKKFSSGSDRVMSGVLKAGGMLFEAFAPKDGAKEAAASLIENISGVATDPKPAIEIQPAVEEKDTEEEMIVSSIASNIFQHYQDKPRLMAVGTLIHEILKNPEMVEKYTRILQEKNSNTQESGNQNSETQEEN